MCSISTNILTVLANFLGIQTSIFWKNIGRDCGNTNDDDDPFEKDIKSVKSSDRSSDSSSSNSELFDEVEFSSKDMCENGSPECSMDEEDSVSC